MLELSGYTTKEKLAIAEQHLLPRALEGHGMKDMARSSTSNARN